MTMEIKVEYLGMTKEQYEAEITKICASTSNFKESGSFMVCQSCGKRYSKKYIGTPLNERMIEHYNEHVRRFKYWQERKRKKDE